MNIFVGNLSFEAKEADVLKAFMSFGQVDKVVIVMDKNGKKSRGFGFVEMPNDSEAQAAITALNNKEILGRPVNVMPSLPKKEKIKHHEPKNKEPGQGGFFKREDKYKRGRRSLSYMKKFGVAPTDSGSKFKANPMRWRKKSAWSKSAETSKPWDKAGEPPKPWQKREGNSKPWQKREGGTKPWQKKEGGAKPWVKREGSAKPSRFKRPSSAARHKR